MSDHWLGVHLTGAQWFMIVEVLRDRVRDSVRGAEAAMVRMKATEGPSPDEWADAARDAVEFAEAAEAMTRLLAVLVQHGPVNAPHVDAPVKVLWARPGVDDPPPG